MNRFFIGIPLAHSMERRPLIQVCSDLHLDYGDLSESDFPDVLVPSSDLLILAGDIGSPFSLLFEDFLAYCSRSYRHVLFVPGNHEYYYSTLPHTHRLLHAIFQKYPNLHLLDETTSFEYKGVLFVGCTLWSHVTDGSPLTNEFYAIREFPLSKRRALYETHVAFIQEMLAYASDKKMPCVVITHYAPSLRCISSEYLDDATHCWFASPLDSLMEHPSLRGWVYGHTHHNIHETDTKGAFLYANCFRGENYCSSFSLLEEEKVDSLDFPPLAT